jgi:Fic-DOC domain mobile mystery protein B
MKIFNEYPLGATPLSEEEKEGLKLKHIKTRAELDRWEQENIQEAFSWLSHRRKSGIVSEVFLRKLHEKMFNKVWVWAGDFRRSEKNIGIEWIKVPIALRQLLGDVKYWIDNKINNPDVIAAKFHHQLVAIHLFPNGNGRHSRLVADILLEELGQKQFSWGSGDLSATGDLRTKYIAALKAADEHDYSLLLAFARS